MACRREAFKEGKNCKQFQQEVPNFSERQEREKFSTIYHFCEARKDGEYKKLFFTRKRD